MIIYARNLPATDDDDSTAVVDIDYNPTARPELAIRFSDSEGVLVLNSSDEIVSTAEVGCDRDRFVEWVVVQGPAVFRRVARDLRQARKSMGL